MIESQAENERPVYNPEQQVNKELDKVFNNIDKASCFWKLLWESEGTGDIDTVWLNEGRCAIREKVPTPPEEPFSLTINQAAKTISKKRNWSAPGPDRITNYWWKRATCLHEGIARSFQTIMQSNDDFPMWFTEGKTSLIPKPGAFSSQNQRPITCLNTIYKWFTSCMLYPVNKHLGAYELMEKEQRGARVNCSGTLDNLLIDRMVCRDSKRGRKNISMAWVDVSKAFDSVNHKWLIEMFSLHRFPEWIGNVISRLCLRWNTKIHAITKQGPEASERIMFKRGLPQGDALCPLLFTLCLNPIAWKLRASEGYRLSKPINAKITDLLYIDDLKIFASNEGKLERVMGNVKSNMEDIGLQWNDRKCSVVHVKRGIIKDSDGMSIGPSEVIESLKKDSQYKFLGVLENTEQQDKLVLEYAEKEYLKRVSMVWSSPLSDLYKVQSTNQYALPVLTYFMLTQEWPIADLKRLDRETRKILVENGAKHPLSSINQLYTPRRLGGRGLKSIEAEYKATKIKVAVKLCSNMDPTMKLVKAYEEKSLRKGHRSLLKDAGKYAQDLGMKLELSHPEPSGLTEAGERIDKERISVWINKAKQTARDQEIKEEKWQGKLLNCRWQDDDLGNDCLNLFSKWTTAPTCTVVGMEELYQQLLPTKIYSTRKSMTSSDPDVRCRLCGKGQENMAHILSGCSALAQTAYLTRHNAALKILFFEVLKVYGLAESIPPWYSPKQPKPLYEGENVKAFWDVPVFADQTDVRANRIDARIEDKEKKTVILLEMSCPWVENRKQKEEEKTLKYAPLRLELKRQHKGFNIIQHNIVIDVLGGYSKGLEKTLKYAPLRLELKRQHKGFNIIQHNIVIDVLGGYSKGLVKSVGQIITPERCKEVIMKMQKSVVNSSLNIAKRFKIMQ